MVNDTFDLVVIGSGPGGYEVAIKASLKGLKVAIIEKNLVGGTCLNVGCIPTKTLYQSAKLVKLTKEMGAFGVNASEVSLDFNRVLERKDEVVEGLKKGIVTGLANSWVRIYEGAASFIDDERIHISHPIDNKIIGYKNVIIATGSKEIIPPIKGHDLVGVLTSSDLLSLPMVPKKLLIIGGGVIGCEMASIYHQFGSEVVIVEALDRILNTLDKDVSSRMKAMMKKDGISIQTSTKVMEISRVGEKLHVLAENKKGETVQFDASHVLMAVGRKPNVEHLNLSAVGIDADRKGIIVDENFMTSHEGIYAVGDCIGGLMLAHTATYQSFAALDHMMNQQSLTNFKVTPSCVFTFPEIGSVGLNEQEAIEHFGEGVKVSKALFRANGKAQAMGEVEGFVKLIGFDGKLVGAHIVGESSSTIIHEASLIIDEEIPIKNCVAHIHAHPTLSEVLLEGLRGLV